MPGQPVFDFLLWHHFSMGAPHWTPPGLHLAQSFLFRSNQQGWSATGLAFLPLPVVTVYFMNFALLMVSAGHFGFEPLLGFFLAASATTTRSSSRTTKWCHRMMYCGVA